MSPHTLVLVAHPDLAGSRVNAALSAAAHDVDGVTVHDLVDARSRTADGRFDVLAEQRLLVAHERIVLQFPWYWYSVPGILKDWMDQVLLYGFAYGSDGVALRGKTLQVITSTGGPGAAYEPGGYNRFTMTELLRPIDATAHLCGLVLAEPLVVHGARTVGDDELASYVQRYRALLERESRPAFA